mmetsp:Transcript_8770/g.25506  ORF Transcript_8770/g.25506 Transcript_8770/m.25506 type:complete len:288 (+) Transcript_8770:1203-2066(+)
MKCDRRAQPCGLSLARRPGPKPGLAQRWNPPKKLGVSAALPAPNQGPRIHRALSPGPPRPPPQARSSPDVRRCAVPCPAACPETAGAGQRDEPGRAKGQSPRHRQASPPRPRERHHWPAMRRRLQPPPPLTGTWPRVGGAVAMGADRRRGKRRCARPRDGDAQRSGTRGLALALGLGRERCSSAGSGPRGTRMNAWKTAAGRSCTHSHRSMRRLPRRLRGESAPNAGRRSEWQSWAKGADFATRWERPASPTFHPLSRVGPPLAHLAMSGVRHRSGRRWRGTKDLKR